jgi:haloacetate dehalogenase
LDTDVVERLAVLDIVPTGEALRRADFDFLMTFWPWSLLAQPEPLPERLVSADPAVVVDDALQNWGSDASAFPPEVRQAYVQALSTIEAVHAVCEEYRAAATIDRDFDDQDLRAGRRIQCSTLALWSKGGALDRWYDNEGGVTGVWRRWATDVRGNAIEGGHFFPEQNPAAVIAELRSFFAARN